MTKAPILYALEYGSTERGGEVNWSPLVDRYLKPITFGGSSGKVRAVKFAKELSLRPIHEALRVKRGAEVVWAWTRETKS